VLDEPTNDLDIETLDLLEDLLLEFSGTLLVVSHDRDFLDNVVTSTLVFEGGGQVAEYAGGYTDWVRQRPVAAGATPPAEPTRPQPAAAPASGRKRRLSFKETKELEALPQEIDTLEQERERLYASLADPVFLRDGVMVAEAKGRLASVIAELTERTGRWESLETIARQD
jgi:ATP-binding cassette subfamily F protein uup